MPTCLLAHLHTGEVPPAAITGEGEGKGGGEVGSDSRSRLSPYPPVRELVPQSLLSLSLSLPIAARVIGDIPYVSDEKGFASSSHRIRSGGAIIAVLTLWILSDASSALTQPHSRWRKGK